MVSGGPGDLVRMISPVGHENRLSPFPLPVDEISSVDLARSAEWDIRNEFETIDGMSVYCGGDLCDLWDLAYREHVDQYNFDALNGMELKVFERLRAVEDDGRQGTWPGTDSSELKCFTGVDGYDGFGGDRKIAYWGT